MAHSQTSGSTLTIDGDGSLTANGGTGGAGIGGGYASSRASVFLGDITISGGTVTATGGNNGPGIGCGLAESDSRVSCGNITISGGTITATGGTGGAGIGGGDSGASGAIIISGDFAVSESNGSSVIEYEGGTVTATGGEWAADIGLRLRIAENAKVTLDGATLPKGIELEGFATIYLAGENTVGADRGNAGISVPEYVTLTIEGDGSLTASGGDNAAGIGGGSNSSCGDITISDRARVKATKGDGAEFSIGPAFTNFRCGTVTINGDVWGEWIGDRFVV